MGIIVFIYAISFIQGSIFALIVLFSNIYRSNVNKYLAYTILTISIISLLNALQLYFGDPYPFIFALFDRIPFEMLFPATFLTFISLKSNSNLFKGKHVFLYVPFCLFSIVNIIIVTFREFGLISDSAIITFIYPLFDLQYYIILLYTISAGAISIVLINNTNHLEGASKKWLKYFVAIYSSLILIWVLIELYSIITDIESAFMEYVLWFGVTTFFYWMSYKGLIQFKLLEDRYEITQIIKSTFSKEKKEVKRDTSNIHFQNLEGLMHNNHSYLDVNLSRENIADQIGISPGYLSKIINTITNNNFSEYINSYRIDAVKNMIGNPEFNKYSLLAIGLESGFTSKTGFYNAFKKQTGMTPKSYKAKIIKA